MAKADNSIYYNGNENLLVAGATVAYEPWQIEEIQKCAEDPIYFFENYVKITHVDHGIVPFVPWDFQKELVRSIYNNNRVLARWARQIGKQLDIETPVFTPNGLVKLGDLRVGDVIYGPDGKQTNITFITETRYNDKTYEVVFDNGDVIKACADHLWTVKSENWKRRDGKGGRLEPSAKTLSTEKLLPFLRNVKTQKKNSRPYIEFTTPLEMAEAELPIDPYTLGVWLGDGNKADARVTCHVDDLAEYRKHIDIDKEYPEYARRSNSGNVIQFKIRGLHGKICRENLRFNKHVPSVYLTGSYEQRLELLKGLMDTDGSVVAKGSSCEFYQKDEMLIDSVRTLLATLGIKSRKRPKLVNGRIYWTATFRPTMPVFKLPRKVERQNFTQNHPKNNRLYIHEIREVDSVPMRCLQVDNESHLFLAGNTLIPTHNTTTVAAVIMHEAMFKKKQTIAILAHKVEQAQEILFRIQESYELLPTWLQIGVNKWNERSVRFANGSRIFVGATSGGSIRGKSLNFLMLDEFCHVEPNLQEKFYTGVLPTLSSGTSTKLVITSTPNGMDLFYKLWTDSENGRNSFIRSFAPWSAVPGRTDEWRQKAIADSSEAQFAQEHEVEFLGSTNTLVGAWKLKILTWLNPFSVVDNVTIFKKAEPKHTYVCCVDSSEGLNQDYHAVTIIDATCIPYEVVAVYRSNDMHHLLLPNIVYNLCKLYNEAVCLIEAMSTGAQIATILLHDLEYEGVLTTTLKGRNGQRIGGGSGDMRLGVQMNKQVKRIGCTNLKALIEDDKIVLNDERIVKELFTFVVKDTHGFAAEEGHNDDLVMSLVLFAWLVSQNFFKDSTDTDIRQSLYDQNIARIEQDLTPFGFITDGVDDTIEEQNVITYNPGLVYY